jgi:hypothetical protein
MTYIYKSDEAGYSLTRVYRVKEDCLGLRHHSNGSDAFLGWYAVALTDIIVGNYYLTRCDDLVRIPLRGMEKLRDEVVGDVYCRRH